MCLAIVKPVGVKLPKKRHLSNGFANNPDGAGIAWWAAGEKQVHILKGMMSEQSFFHELARLGDCKNKLMLIHFRQATAGRICPENCHPFPVSKESAHLQSTHIDTPIAVIHNGIIVDYDSNDDPQWYKWGNYSLSGGSLKDELSDTQRFIIDYMVPLGDKIWDSAVQKLMLGYTGSKLAWIDNNGQSAIIGKFENRKGSWYSNSSYSYSRNFYPIVTTKQIETTSISIKRSGIQQCGLCGEWVSDSEIIEFEDMPLCADCHKYMYQEQYSKEGWEEV